MADFVGQQFGNYLLTHYLKGGGFADVYLGEHRLLKMRAAIKVIRDQLNKQEFLEEARTIAALAHPNIVRVLEFDAKELSKNHWISFLVMDYAAQGTLRDRHPRGTILPLTTVFSYTQQVADALQFAHDNRIIHRDVKPENMLIDAQGKILLSDFGIAAIEHSTSSRKTIDAIGTPLYMAPEQWNGQPRPASDQYSLGIIVYEWLSGQPPFLGNQHALPHQHNNVPPAPFAPSLRIPAEMENAVQRALAKIPEQRFPDVKSFVQALRQNNQMAPGMVAQPNYASPAQTAPQRPIPPTIPVMVAQQAV
ncbi:MAG: serine/threonine-protein kinase, partial [Ktedonobacteraceae bacterium]